MNEVNVRGMYKYYYRILRELESMFIAGADPVYLDDVREDLFYNATRVEVLRAATRSIVKRHATFEDTRLKWSVRRAGIIARRRPEQPTPTPSGDIPF